MSHPLLHSARLRCRELVISRPEPEPVPDTPGVDPRFFIHLDIAARILRMKRPREDNVRSLEHWARKGWTLPGDDVPVVLQTVRIGGRFMTTRAWCLEFAHAKWEAYRRRDAGRTQEGSFHG